MNEPVSDDRRCPICGGPNECRIANGCLYKGSCWCEAIDIPPLAQRRFADLGLERACLCGTCFEAVAQREADSDM